MEEIPHRNGYGDLVFDDRVRCNFSESHATHDREAEREDIDIAADFLIDMATFFSSVFPYASIQIVLPSEYYGQSGVDDSIFEQTLRTKFYGILPEKHLTQVAKIIFQPPYSSIAQVCVMAGVPGMTAYAHANEDGRVWRTRNLVEFMR
jgi:hypothetical protein